MTLLNDIDISVRLLNSLWLNGIKTVDELQKLSDKELLKLRKFGKVCLREAKEIQDKYKERETK